MNLDLEIVVRKAFGDAKAAGFDHIGQTVFGLQAVRMVRPDMTETDALAAVNLVQQESPPTSTPMAQTPAS